MGRLADRILLCRAPSSSRGGRSNRHIAAASAADLKLYTTVATLSAMPQCIADSESWDGIERCKCATWVVACAFIERVVARRQTRRMHGNEIWSDQPSPGDLAVALKHKPAVVRDDAITMLAPNARHLVPRRSRKDVVYGMKVVPKEKQDEDQV